MESIRPAMLALVLALSAASSAVAAQLTRAPYLNSVSQTSAIVAFQVGASCAATVRYAPSGGGPEQAAHAARAGASHAIRLDGLSPGTEYTYRLEACGAAVGTPRKFRTAPPLHHQAVRFATVGDIGNGSPDVILVGRQIHAARPDVLVTLGDNAYPDGTETDFQTRFFEPLSPMLSEVPIFPAVGNHEYVTQNAGPYLSNFHMPANNPRGTERYYSFRWGFVHFVALDSQCNSSSLCTPSEQAQWLARDLEASSAAWKVVYMHHPPWSSGAHGSATAVRAAFAPVFEKYGVDLVLTGHDHNYERSKPMKGTTPQASFAPGAPVYLVVGSGGASLRSFPSSQPGWSAFRNNQHKGYLDVSVEGGTLTGRFVTTQGQVLDTFQLTKSVPPPPPPAEPGPGQVSLLAERARGAAPFTARLHAQAAAGSTFTWDLGDGARAEGASVSHTYASPGTYPVRVRAQSGQAVAEATATVVVDPPGTVPDLPLPPPPGPGNTPDANPEGGCASAGGALLAPLAAVWLLFARRRRG